MTVLDLLRILLILALCATSLILCAAMAWEYRTLDTYLWLVGNVIAQVTLFSIPFEKRYD